MTNLSGFNPSKQLNLQQSFPNLNSMGAGAAGVGAAPSTPQFANTDLSKLGALTTGYGDSTRYEKFHPALDIANKIGTPIPTFAGGTVVEEATGKKQGDKGYGNYVIVKDQNGNSWRYSHLYSSYVKVGDTLAKGQILGQMGNTGSAYSTSATGTGSHLDLRVRDAYNQYVNPNTFFRKTT